MVSLCKVWGTVRYLHPYLAYKDIDWDAALVEALPKAEAAKDDDEFRAAVQAMLDRLGDPATRVARTVAQPADQPSSGGNEESGHPLFSWVEDDVLLVHLDRPMSFNQLVAAKARPALQAAVEKASAVIVDLRSDDEYQSFISGFILGWVAPHLPAREVRAPSERYLVHSGYRPQIGTTSGGYDSAFHTTLAEAFPAAAGGKGKRTVFLVVEKTELPPIAMALYDAGDAFLVAQGKAPAGPSSGQRVVPLSEHFEARIRTTEMIGPSGPVQLRPDAEVPADADRGRKGPAVQKAIALLRNAPRSKKSAPGPAAGAAAVAPGGAWRPDKRYDTTSFPQREYRLLAMFRFWNVIHYFYPYKDLLDQDWDTVLPRFLPAFAAAGDAREYGLAVAEMAACIQDSHTNVGGSKELRRYFGEALPALSLRLIEGKPTVTDILDAEAVKDAGVAIGDVVLAVDGEPVDKRMARYGKYIAGSNPAAHALSVLRRLLGGPDGSTLALTIRGRDNETHEIRLPRKVANVSLRPKPKGEVFKVLEDNIGYCNLERLRRSDVDLMLERLKDTRAIVFDLRGYPQGTAWALAPRLNIKGAKYGAAFQRMLVSGGSTTDEGESRFAFRQLLPTGNQWQYKGKTVTLIDERAISQSEHTGLFLEAACATTFIGSITAGANGDVTNLTLPGGLTVGFTGHDVRHVDGRQLQRVGLAPHIEVRPTLAGIRAGRDEVLARALQYLREGK
jgi:C-terminal processing protease CtpA/Prc